MIKEVRFIQGKFVKSKKVRKVEDISKVFVKLEFPRRVDYSYYALGL